MSQHDTSRSSTPDQVAGINRKHRHSKNIENYFQDMFRLGSFPRSLTTNLKIFQKLKWRPLLILSILDKGHSAYKTGALGDYLCSPFLSDSGYKEVWVPGLLALIQHGRSNRALAWLHPDSGNKGNTPHPCPMLNK